MSRRDLGSARVPQVGHHRWASATRASLPATRYGHFNRAARVLLFNMRWRKPPSRPVVSVIAWTLSLCLHLLVMLLMVLAPPPASAPSSTSETQAISVRLIQAPPKPPPPPPPPKLPVRRAPTRHVATAPHSGQATLPDMTVAAPKHVAKPKKPAKPSPKHNAAVAKTPAPQPRAVSPVPVPQAPPPPKVAVQVTPLSLPEPKVASDVASRVSSPSSPDTPVPVPRLQVSSEAPKPGLQAPHDEHPHAAVQGVTLAEVTPAPTSVPQPKIQPQATRPDVAAPSVQVQPQNAPAPIVHAPALPRAAAAPAAAPRIDLPRTRVQVGAPALPQARLGPLALPTAPQPVRITTAPRQVASTASVPAPSTSTSWAKSSAADQFDTSKAPAGKGVRLYGKHGALALSGSGSGKGKTPDYIQREPQGNSDVMWRTNNAIHYKSTRFNKYWTPLGETALQTAFRHLVEEFTYTKTLHMGRGARIKCAISPLLLMSFFSCGSGNPPSPPPPTDGDRRLDMAPAVPLVKGLGPKPAASSPSPPLPTKDTTSCVTAKVAGSPPPPGCPLPDTQQKKSDQW